MGQAAGANNELPLPVGAVPISVPVWQRTGFANNLRRYTEPRLLMTAAMAFFSIALTLNLTGNPLRYLRFTSLRPNAVRSFMERRLIKASTPIVRYYDHLRLVNEVEAGVRELRRSTVGEGLDENLRQKLKDSLPASPGESRKTTHQREGGSGVEPPQQSESPMHLNSMELLEASLTFQDRPAYSGGPARAVWERSTVWTA
jgi:hypothetical protein